MGIRSTCSLLITVPIERVLVVAHVCVSGLDREGDKPFGVFGTTRRRRNS